MADAPTKPQPTKVQQAVATLQLAEALDALGRMTRETGVLQIQTKPLPCLSSGRTRLPVPEAIAVAMGQAAGEAFGRIINQLTRQASQLAAEAAQPTEPPAEAAPNP